MFKKNDVVVIKHTNAKQDDTGYIDSEHVEDYLYAIGLVKKIYKRKYLPIQVEIFPDWLSKFGGFSDYFAPSELQKIGVL